MRGKGAHFFVHLVAQFLFSLSFGNGLIGEEGTCHVGHDARFFASLSFLIGVDEAENGSPKLYGIGKRNVRKRADARVIGPNMCLGINDDGVPFGDAGFDGGNEITVCRHAVGERQSAERGRHFSEQGHGNVVRVNDDVIALGKIDKVRHEGIPDVLGVIAIHEVARFFIRAQAFLADDLAAKGDLGVEKSDGGCNDAIPKKAREAFEKRSVDVAIAAVDLLGRDNGGRKLIVQFVGVVYDFSLIQSAPPFFLVSSDGKRRYVPRVRAFRSVELSFSL